MMLKTSKATRLGGATAGGKLRWVYVKHAIEPQEDHEANQPYESPSLYRSTIFLFQVATCNPVAPSSSISFPPIVIQFRLSQVSMAMELLALCPFSRGPSTSELLSASDTSSGSESLSWMELSQASLYASSGGRPSPLSRTYRSKAIVASMGASSLLRDCGEWKGSRSSMRWF